VKVKSVLGVALIVVGAPALLCAAVLVATSVHAFATRIGHTEAALLNLFVATLYATVGGVALSLGRMLLGRRGKS
jgi:hypothetical protein